MSVSMTFKLSCLSYLNRNYRADFRYSLCCISSWESTNYSASLNYVFILSGRVFFLRACLAVAEGAIELGPSFLSTK